MASAAVKRVRVECAGIARWLKIRELCGEDEETVADTDTQSAIDLLDRLLVAGPGADVQPGHAAELSTSERDFALASVFVETFGDRLRETVRCTECGARFDFELDLADLVASKRPARSSPTDLVFRIPTGLDELAVASTGEGAEAALLRRCFDGDPARIGEVAEAMEAVAPLLEAELVARCVECGATNLVAFDVQTQLLLAIAREHASRANDVHRLAMGYGWSLTEILGLSRARRREYALRVDGGGA